MKRARYLVFLICLPLFAQRAVEPIWYIEVPGSMVMWKVRAKDSLWAFAAAHATVFPQDHFEKYPQPMIECIVDLVANPNAAYDDSSYDCQRRRLDYLHQKFDEARKAKR